MSLSDLFQPAPVPKRKGKVVRGLKREAEEKRKAETLARYEETKRAASATMKAERMKALNADPAFKAKLAASARERMKALHADPAFKAKLAKGLAVRLARVAEAKFEQAKARLFAARKAAGIDEESCK